MVFSVASKVCGHIIHFAVVEVLIVCHLLCSLKIIYQDKLHFWAEEEAHDLSILIRD